MLLGKMPHRRTGWAVDWPRTNAIAHEVLSNFGFPGIDISALASDLPVSVQQIVEIAKALVVTPRVLILDEPSSVLSVRETDLLFAKIRDLVAGGTTVLYISHRLEEIFEISDDVVVLKDGVSVLQAETKTLDRDRLITAMVGRSLQAIYPVRTPSPGAPLLEVRGSSPNGHLRRCQLRASRRRDRRHVRACRQRPDRRSQGDIRGNARDVRRDRRRRKDVSPSPHRPMQSVRASSLVTEDRKRDGLLLDASVIDNGGLASMPRFSRHGFLNRKRQAEVVTAKLDELAVRPRGARGPIRSLSGGNQQKVVLGKWMLVENVRVFLFDEPTRGVDIATKVANLPDDRGAGGKPTGGTPDILGDARSAWPQRPPPDHARRTDCC